MKVKIVTDSSANLFNDTCRNLSFAPLTIIAGDNVYRDDETLDLDSFVKELKEYKGKSSTACPGPNDWLEAFDDAELIFCITLTGKLSGCYNSAKAAADLYMEENPQCKVFVFDSLSTGPELELLVEKIEEVIVEAQNNSCDLSSDSVINDMIKKINDYNSKTQLAFSLKSVSNFAKNGRVNAHIARAAELLHIHIVGRASSVGDLEMLNKSRGESNSIKQVFANMKSEGFKGGKVIIRHTFNEAAANILKSLILSEFPTCKLTVGFNRGLCSYYAEPGSILVGFEA